jgi:hypothetical protein
MAARYPATPESTNYARLCRLVVDICTDALRHLLNSQLTLAQLGVAITSNKQLLWSRLNPDQRLQFYPPPGTPQVVQPSEFDISLLYILLRNVCTKLPPPTNGWGSLPPVIAVGLRFTDEVERIRTCRNTIYGHVTKAAVSKADFNRYWTDIDAVLGRLDQAWSTQFHQDAQKLKVECMDPEMELCYMGQFHALCLSDQQTQQGLQAVQGQVNTLCLSDQQTQQGLQAVQCQVNTLSLSDQQTQQDLQAVQGQVNTLCLSDQQTQQRIQAVEGNTFSNMY